MRQFILKLKDESKADFLLELLSSFAFVEVTSALESPIVSVPTTFGVPIEGGPASVTYTNVEEGYREMAADRAREQEASEWIEGTLNVE